MNFDKIRDIIKKKISNKEIQKTINSLSPQEIKNQIKKKKTIIELIKSKFV